MEYVAKGFLGQRCVSNITGKYAECELNVVLFQMCILLVCKVLKFWHFYLKSSFLLASDLKIKVMFITF